MPPPIAWYREFVPCKALRADVYALFSFVPGPIPRPTHRPLLREVAFGETTLCAPQFADGHVSMVFELGKMCRVGEGWCPDSLALRATVIGPMSAVGRTERCDLPETVGAYFRPARVAPFVRVPISDLINRTVPIEDVWGMAGSRLPSELCDLDEAARIERLESILVAHFDGRRQRARTLDVDRLAASIVGRRGRMTVEVLAQSAGVSRQYLTREFRERIGIGPKLYSRLARFQSGLVYAGRRAKIQWAGAAGDLGYADQSHMIAEFHEFSGLTPQALASRSWFHPFIERAKLRGEQGSCVSGVTGGQEITRCFSKDGSFVIS